MCTLFSLESQAKGSADFASYEDGAPDLQLTVFPIQIEPHLESASSARQDRDGTNAKVRFDQAIVTIAVVRPSTRYAIWPVRGADDDDDDVAATARSSYSSTHGVDGDKLTPSIELMPRASSKPRDDASQDSSQDEAYAPAKRSPASNVTGIYVDSLSLKNVCVEVIEKPT